MAHYVASVNLFEYPGRCRASVKVFRVYEYGAKPSRPVWKHVLEGPSSPDRPPREWLLEQLQGLVERL